MPMPYRGEETEQQTARQRADACFPSVHRTVLRVYYGPPTAPQYLQRSTKADQHLPVPLTDKNFLISPPGSPPIGWEQIREDPPNSDTLAADLMQALQELQLEQPSEPELPAAVAVAPVAPTPPRQAETLIISADSHHPSVLISDTETFVSPLSPYAITLLNTPGGIRRTPSPAPPLPALDITQVKATVDSMRSFPSVGADPLSESGRPATRITPTARPPLA